MAGRERYVELLSDHSRHRDLCDLSLEYAGGEHPRMDLRRFHRGGLVEHLPLAGYDAHGRWLEWTVTAEDT